MPTRDQNADREGNAVRDSPVAKVARPGTVLCGAGVSRPNLKRRSAGKSLAALPGSVLLAARVDVAEIWEIARIPVNLGVIPRAGDKRNMPGDDRRHGRVSFAHANYSMTGRIQDVQNARTLVDGNAPELF
ncbi:MAG: hypothetical protein JWM11_4796, partial [Planctomycetaceae bacterium]|nr:hypothetical protein [Planctomycetaceae bacterium]